MMQMELTRRELAGALAGAAAARAQAPAEQPEGPEQLLTGASGHLRSNSELLAKYTVPMNAEPAFAFRA